MASRPPELPGPLGISAEHLELYATARRWVDAHVDPHETKAALDEDVERLPRFWPALREMGWLGLHLDEVHGGEGFGLPELAVVLEALGHACTPGPFLPTVLTSAVIQAAGTDEQRARRLPGLADGSVVGAVAVPAALTDPGVDGPGVAASVVADVAADGRSLVLRGTVRPVPGASLADLLVIGVRARSTDVEKAIGPIRWCLVPRGAPGVRVEPLASTDGTRRVAAVHLHDVEIPWEDCLPESVASSDIALLAATLLAAESVGGAAWCVETAAAYACAREQFGRPIGQFQAVKHRCAAMVLALEQARAVGWDAARSATAPDDRGARLARSIAGAVVPDVYAEIAKDTVAVLGGIGYTWDHDVHLHVKRSIAGRSLLGGPASWRTWIAGQALDGVRRERRVELPPAAEPIRDQVRSFVAALTARPKPEWNATMADAGYLAPHWPRPWGRSAPPLEQLIIDEELAAARIRRPHLQVGGWVLPTLIAHGTHDQQERWVRPTLQGEILWCQLFSEPGAGSDLAALSTRAVRDHDRAGWVITGQKVWTTMAHLAQWGLLLARTDPEVPKHEGITCFVLDMGSAGIDIRPLRELTGAALFNEVFLDEVFVPDANVVGPVNGGWQAARTTLANERVSMGSGASFGPGVEAILTLVTEGHRQRDAIVMERLGALVADAHALGVMGLRTTLRSLTGAGAGAEASVRKLLATEHEQALQELGLDLLGPEAATVEGPAAAWVNGFLGNRALSIAGGTSDIQRNVIAERLLGLPKDPEPGF